MLGLNGELKMWEQLKYVEKKRGYFVDHDEELVG